MSVLRKFLEFRFLFFPLSSVRDKLENFGKVKLKGYGINIRNTCFEGHNMIAGHSQIDSSVIGFGTYITNNSTIVKTKIGKYCSIADHVKTGFGGHPTMFVSTYPAFYYDTTIQLGFNLLSSETEVEKDEYSDNLYTPFKFADSAKKYLVIISDDVWVGSHVLIMDGITIGTGAIVAAGAVVTKDVPPYAVVGGVPAKIIKFRHDEETIKKLLASEWWNRPIEWIRQNAPRFFKPDIF